MAHKCLARYCRVVNGPTSSGPNPARNYKPEPGPNPKINLKPKSCPKKPESWVRSKKFSNIAKLFWLFFCTLRQTVRLRPELSPKLFSTLGPNPARTRTRSEKPGPTYNSAVLYTPATILTFQKNSSHPLKPERKLHAKSTGCLKLMQYY